MVNALELKNVDKEFEQFHLQGVNFAVPAGTIMGLIGENGAGKTTIIKMLLGVQYKDNGEITVFDYPVESLPIEEKENIGLVWDEFPYPDTLNIAELEKIMAHLYQQWDKERFQELCHRFSLPDKKKLKTFSTGMKRKLQLAVAMSHQAKLLILDEATSGLDPIVREEILDLLLEFIQNEQCAVLLSSHIISDLEKVCDYITYLHQGKIVFSEEKDSLREQYGIFKGSQEQLAELPTEAVVGVRKHQFGTEALIWREKVAASTLLETASIEDIMLYYNRREAI